MHVAAAGAMSVAAAETLADRLAERLDAPAALEPWPLDLGGVLSFDGPLNRRVNGACFSKLKAAAAVRGAACPWEIVAVDVRADEHRSRVRSNFAVLKGTEANGAITARRMGVFLAVSASSTRCGPKKTAEVASSTSRWARSSRSRQLPAQRRFQRTGCFFFLLLFYFYFFSHFFFLLFAPFFFVVDGFLGFCSKNKCC